MEAKYTPGPWSINEWPQKNSDISIGAIGTPLIARVTLRDVSINEQKDNARRIVACVNACEGIPTEALECQSKRKISEAWVKQRDKLVSACKRAEAFIAGFDDDETQEGIAGLLAELRSAAGLNATA